MTDENVRNLLGGFATGTLTDDERNLLFAAALKDQDLFDALADEEVLREFLSDTAARRRLLQLLQPGSPGVIERITSWIRRPVGWAVVGVGVAALAVVVATRDAYPPEIKIAQALPPTPAAVQRSESSKDEARPLARRDAPAPSKMKVAVLEFDSGPAPAKETESKKADLGKTASDLLGKKLDSDGYMVIDRKQVVSAMQAQKLNERQLSPAAAASLGRSLGADAVIMGSVKQPAAMSFADNASQGGARQEARAKPAQSETVEVTATAINPLNAVSLGYVQGQSAPGALSGAVDQVASSLGQQLQQNARVKIEGLVSDVNAKILTLNVGALAGIKIGDRLEIRRAGKPVGRVAITAVQEDSSVGLFDGPDLARIGDIAANQ